MKKFLLFFLVFLPAETYAVNLLTRQMPETVNRGSSWLMDARNRDLARFDSSALRRASSEMERAISSSAIRALFSF